MTQIQLSYPDAECPDCGQPIADDVTPGEACSNCGYVFWDSDEVYQTL